MTRQLILLFSVALVGTSSCVPAPQPSNQRPGVQLQFFERGYLYFVEDATKGKVQLVNTTTGEAVSVQVDRPFQYIHLMPNRGGFAVLSSGELGFLSWRATGKGSVLSVYTPTERFKGKQLAEVVAWAHSGVVQVACDRNGMLLITDSQTLTATFVRVPEFPRNVQRVLVAIINDEEGHPAEVLISGMVGIEVWSWRHPI